MKIKDIIKDCGAVSVTGNRETEVTSVCSDSRKAAAGAMFIAVRGFAGDGHTFIGKALLSGASAIVYEDRATLGKELESIYGNGDIERISLEKGHVFIKTGSSRHALAIIASNFYGRPSEQLTLVGITGTNGKTTTVTLLYRLFTGLGYHCGLLSTIANYVGERKYEAVNTTSDPITINSLLAGMVDEGCEYCFMEVSSIGVQQERIAGLKFKVGIFSNLTHDHLDYHKTFAEYLRCKKLFFDMLPADAFAITNTDDKNGTVMVQNTAARVITYSCKSIADHTCRIMEESFDGMLLRIDGTESWTRLTGRHNAYNILAIYSTAVTLGVQPEEALVAISRLESAPGRLETLRGPKDLSVVIDYAHTPDALENVLTTLRDIAPERELICLFGCGGDRDKTKRPEMAQVAQRLADRIIVTSDNSRTERTSDIMEDIKAGMDAKGRARTLFIEDRKEAIRAAIMMAGPGATVLLAGKGHETYQIIGTEKHRFDEKEIVAEIFKEM
ncbi:MAG: UDP-N-acetylmuramoyl-L-alanyl-D-glutamate--2,6-diaminopimelate ligase [Bacteroidetes bacterium]|uniref:UDP-N-acetylmuramyl-tripeptide synthetase n=1 Tax=Candidatus Cryptobacteroides avicola TaxID=2840757 RepID=A0A940DRR8_9BACT|nr:UDP-N-acetylmuramoyl-L-alanyl-D-glutamate--2,6-diaminopimelate ligase [Candidatus Cryptobacteroides avicola]